jgi:hypothetical protein
MCEMWETGGGKMDESGGCALGVWWCGWHTREGRCWDLSLARGLGKRHTLLSRAPVHPTHSNPPGFLAPTSPLLAACLTTRLWPTSALAIVHPLIVAAAAELGLALGPTSAPNFRRSGDTALVHRRTGALEDEVVRSQEFPLQTLAHHRRTMSCCCIPPCASAASVLRSCGLQRSDEQAFHSPHASMRTARLRKAGKGPESPESPESPCRKYRRDLHAVKRGNFYQELAVYHVDTLPPANLLAWGWPRKWGLAIIISDRLWACFKAG